MLCQQLMSFGADVRAREPSAPVNDLLRGLAPIIERLLAARRVRLSMTLAPEVGRVRMSSVELEQVVMNLVLNAADATAERGEVEVAAALEGSEVLLEVRDRGVGIRPEHVDRIFDAYFTTKGDKGNGLGLRNVWQIVTGSGGRVEVESAVGEGSTFSVFLPVLPSSGVLAPPP
jgi:signal transduction histidine kinase